MSWVAHDIRDQVVDFLRHWSERTELPAKRLLGWRELEMWEPWLAQAFGVAPNFAAIDARLAAVRPRLPPHRTQRVVDRELAGWDFWLTAAQAAIARYHRRRRHPVPSLNQISRWLEINFALQQLACGSFQPDPLREAAAATQMESDLRRAYPAPGQSAAACPSAEQSPPLVAVAPGALGEAPQTVAATPAWPPPHDKRDLTPYGLVRGEHGLLCLRRIAEKDHL